MHGMEATVKVLENKKSFSVPERLSMLADAEALVESGALDRAPVLGLEPKEHLAAESFRIDLLREGETGVASQIDGEEWVRAFHYQIRVEARRLPLLTPRDFTPPWR